MNKPESTPRVQHQLPGAVVLLGWVSFLADVSSEMIYPLIPMFVVGVLGSSATTLGGIEGGAALVVAFVTAWSGWRSDRHQRRVRYVRAGYGLPVIGKALMALAVAWPMVLMARLIDRFGKGLRASPRDALMADAAGPEIRGRAFGYHRAMDTAGALVGVLLSACLLWWLTGSPMESNSSAPPRDAGWAFRVVFGVSAALGVLSLGLTFLVREARPQTKKTTLSNSQPDGPFGLSGAYWRTAALLVVFSLANSSDAFLLLRARDVGLAPWAVVLAYALYNVTCAAFSYPAGRLSDRLGRWRIIRAGWIIYAAVYAGFAFTGAAALWPLLAAYGVYMALTDGVGKALVADHAPPEKRGTALGIFYMASGLATLLASVVAGILWDRLGAAATFGAGAFFAVIAVALMPALIPRSQSEVNAKKPAPENSAARSQ